MNKRLLIALVLSFLVLSFYGYLMPKSTVESNTTAVKSVQVKKTVNSAPVVAPEKETTPVVNSAKVAPVATVGKTIVTVETAKYSLKIDNLGRISSVVLKEAKYKTDDGKPLDIIATKGVKPLEVRFKDEKYNSLAFKNDYSSNAATIDASKKEQRVELSQNIGTITLKKLITFYPDGHYNLKVELPKDVQYFITPGLRPFVDKSRYLVVRGALISDATGIITKFEHGDAKAAQSFNNITVAAAIDRYYATLFYKKSGVFDVTVAPSGITGEEDEPLLFIHAKGTTELNGYVGAKEWKLFSSLDKKLENVIDFGWFTFLARPFFKVMLAIHNYVGNWGWTIVLFTLLVKIVLFPLSYKGLMSMQKMKDLAPKMKELKEKYGKDPAKMNQQMMQLYKKHGANPMGGCLPMLLQIPIFFSLYRVLLNADELQGAPWILWIQDLSRQDPYFVLPILMGITMFIQQKVTPNTMTDPMQRKIFQWLPVLMTFFFLTFPAGLVLYWFVNNVLTIAQQYYINGAYERYKQKVRASQS